MGTNRPLSLIGREAGVGLSAGSGGILDVDLSELDAKTSPVMADSVAIVNSESSDESNIATLTNILKILGVTIAGANATSGISAGADGVLRINVGSTTANTNPATTDKLLIEVVGVNKSVTIADAIKAIGEAMINAAGATGSIAETDGVIKVDIGNTTASTTPAAADKILIEVSGVNKSCTLANLAKAIAATLAGVEATNGLTSDANGVLTVAAKIAHLEAALLKGITVVPMSFESGEIAATKIYFPYKVTINKIRGIVTKAIADTSDGTITGANTDGNSASGVITAVKLDPLNTEYSVSPTTNNVVLANGWYRLTTAKADAGGKVLVTLEWTRTA